MKAYNKTTSQIVIDTTLILPASATEGTRGTGVEIDADAHASMRADWRRVLDLQKNGHMELASS